MLTLEDGEVAVEEGAVGLKRLLTRHLLLDVVRSVHEVVQDLLLDGLGVLLLHLANYLLKLILCAKARP